MTPIYLVSQFVISLAGSLDCLMAGYRLDYADLAGVILMLYQPVLMWIDRKTDTLINTIKITIKFCTVSTEKLVSYLLVLLFNSFVDPEFRFLHQQAEIIEVIFDLFVTLHVAV